MDIEGFKGEAAEDTDAAWETRQPGAVTLDPENLHEDHGDVISSAVDGTEVATNQHQTDGNKVCEGTTCSVAAAADVTAEHLFPGDNSHRGGCLFPAAKMATAAATQPSAIDAALHPVASKTGSSSPTTSTSVSNEGGHSGTEEGEQSSTEGGEHEEDEKHSISGDLDQGIGGDAGHSNDLPTQLKRLWGASPPDRAEGLAVLQNMLRCRQELDVILSRLMTAKGSRTRECRYASSERPFHGNDFRKSLPSSGPIPFTLATFVDRFAPVVTDPLELRERAGARVRVVTAAGLRLGLAKRVFAREPLLPTDIEAEEERQSRQPPGSFPAPADIEDLTALVVPVRATASTAPEMSPEGGPVPYPSMSEVCSVMWCEDDDDLFDEVDDRAGESSCGNRHRLRVSVQTLDGHVCDEEDEDSETDDGGSDTDRASETDEDDHSFESSFFARPMWSGRQPQRERTDARGTTTRAERRTTGTGGNRVAGLRKKGKDEELDEIRYQRKGELFSVLRRLRVAVRRMDGALTEDKIRSMAKRIVRVAAMATSTSELVTIAAARDALRGLGDRTRLERQRGQTGGRDVRWATVIVGVGRWGRQVFGPGFAVETQDKYRLGWLSLSPPAEGIMGGREGSGTLPASEKNGAGGAGVRRRGWAERHVFFRVGRRTGDHQRHNDEEAGIEGWVGSLTCNYCEGHSLGDVSTGRAYGETIASTFGNNDVCDAPVQLSTATVSASATAAAAGAGPDGEENDDIFFPARDSVAATDEGDSIDKTADENAPKGTGTGASPNNGSPVDSPPNDDAGIAFTASSWAPSLRQASGGSRRGVSGEEGKESVEEDGCTGHVCLRLRLNGLRERRSGRSSESGTEAGVDAEEAPDDGSGNDSCFSPPSDGENLDGVDGIDVDGARNGSNSSSRSPSSLGDGGAHRRSRRGVPLSRITKGLFAEGKRNQTDSCGVSSEKSSKSLEVFAWGDNANGCLGLPVDIAAGLLPRTLELFGLLPGERVVALACSERHTLLVTGMGSVYSAGDGTYGALGLGGRESSTVFRLVEWFAERRPPPKVCQVSAGSDLIGCHSAALDADGRLFTWGVGAAAGHASLKPALLPREVETLGGFGTGSEARGTDGRPAGFSSRVKGVSCGGGFTLAVTNGGKVFAWGSWARGRLGLGRPPERTTGRKKRVPRFQASPRRVSGLGRSPVVQVATGAWHGMALTEEGEVYTWGHNASGQLGFLITPSSLSQRMKQKRQLTNLYTPTPVTSTASLSEMLRASWTPVKLPTFGNANNVRVEATRAPVAGGVGSKLGYDGSNSLPRTIVHIACGPEHSIAIDSRGVAWTWGAEGRACLGHGEAGFGAPGAGSAVAAEVQARAMGLAGDGGRRRQAFIPLSRQREVSRARARQALDGGWAVPREIVCLAPPPPPANLMASSHPSTGGAVAKSAAGGVKIVAAAAGTSHTALLTEDGRMYLFGEGAAVTGGDFAAFEGDRGVVEGVGLREAGGLVRRRTMKEEGGRGGFDAVAALSAVAGPTPVPREMCSSWFPTVATRRVAAVACGGQHVIALLGGDHIGYTLGINLFRTAMGTEHLGTDDGAADGDGTGVVGWMKGGVDCELLVAGSYLHAHRVVLAMRSPVLRDMIAQEERPQNDDDDDDGGIGGPPPLQLLLPDIRFDVARALLEFLYTGELRRSLDLDSPLPYDLRAAAKSYGVPRLEALCTEVISLGADPGSIGEGSSSDAEWGRAVPPPSLAGDLGGALGSMEHADVKFVAGGRPIYAHRSVLSCQSEYFAAMFRFRDQMGRSAGETSKGKAERSSHSSAMTEIVVPDSYSCFVRLLLYLYTGVLPESSAESVLEDLISSDRYRLLGMKRVCQSMLRLSANCCLQALESAEMVNAPLLRRASLFYAEHNLSQVSQQEGFRETVSGTPGLAEVVLSRLRATAANASAVSSVAERQKRLHDRSLKRRFDASGCNNINTNADLDDDGDPSFRSDSPFPWGAAMVAMTCGAIYCQVSKVVAMGMFVPVMNGVFFVCLAVFAFHKLKDNGAFPGGGEKAGRRKQLQRAAGVVRKGGAWGGRRRKMGGRRDRRRSTNLFG